MPWPFARIRWRIFSFLFGFGFIAYVQQKSITVAAERMMPELGLTQLQIGWLEQAFVLGYAIFQMPGGVIGQRIGARRTFVVIGLTAFLATIATPLAPDVFSGRLLFLVLLAVQVLLGCSQGAIFPVSAGVFEEWFPPLRWSYVQGLQTMGLGLGAALTPPLIASLMTGLGWQRALLWSSLPALGLIALWAWYGRNTPREHPSVSALELAEIAGDVEGRGAEGRAAQGSALAGDASAGSASADSASADSASASRASAGHASAGRAAPGSALSLRRLLHLVGDRSVLLLAVSYMCMNYTFYLLSNWVFLYLVQERKFSLLESGWLAAAPPLAAAIGAGVGGLATGIACKRFGPRWGFRAVPVAAMPLAGGLLLLAVNATNPYLAVIALAACFGCVELTEGAFWGAGMTVGRGDTMSVCGFMNTGGNLGGIISIPIVAYFSGRHLWFAAFLIGAGFALISAVAWLGIDVAPDAAVRGAEVPGTGT
jgi:ACS family glucarate transporter-like MFS transporter